MKLMLTWVLAMMMAVAAPLVLAVDPPFDASALPKLAQEPQHRQAVTRVAQKYSRSHYKALDIDAKLSSEIFDRYLEALDYQRLFLLDEDIKRLEPVRPRLGEALLTGSLDEIYRIYDLYQQRRYQRFVYALSLLDKPFDFSVKESFEVERKDAPWPKTEAELNELWRLRVKSEALSLKLTGKKQEEIRDTLSKRYNLALKRLQQTNSEDVFQTFVNAYARSIDPHTTYLSPQNAERFSSEMHNSLEGIGAVLQSDDDYTVVRSLVKGGPAERSKQLTPDDRIVAVAQGEDGKAVDVIGWRLDEVVSLIKGPKGTKVRLEVLPANAGADGKTRSIVLVRDKIRLEDRAAKLELIELPATVGSEASKVALVSVPSFYLGVSADVAKLLTKPEVKQASSLVLDLRDNGGGPLEEAAALSGIFLGGGPVVQIRDSDGDVEVKNDPDKRSLYNGPMTVLVNRFSASASEIVAAALQDYGRAVIVGEATFGKGTVQQHWQLQRRYDMFAKPMGDITYTTAKFYRINGGSTQIKGVVPDVALPSALDAGEFGEAQEDNALPWDAIAKADYAPQTPGYPSVNWLVQRHQQRAANDPAFLILAEETENYRAHKNDKVVSLNEAERRAQMAEDDQRRLALENRRRALKNLPPLAKVDEIPSEPEEQTSDDLFLMEAARVALDAAIPAEVAATIKPATQITD
ncbi:MAG: carboxy terminal-processing peptidase [Gammaproteobacteria bacterium]|nr:carboxy terminal-processing peptidase [Gammaproteobacteria bacterium]